jgi:FAD/FMN-containing dehydrogenase
MTQIDRRGVLTAAAVSIAAAGLAACSSAQGPVLRESAGTEAASTTVVPAPGAPDWKGLASRITGQLSLPGMEAYDQVKLVENPRFDTSRPLAVLSATSSRDVSVAVRFAAEAGVPVSIRSGGHNYSGHSSGDAATAGLAPSLVIDVRNLSRITVDADGTVTMGPGASLIQVYEAVGRQGRALAGGSCPTVGIAGLTLGGGVGVLTRAYGLTSDALLSAEIVIANGEIVTANARDNADLLWACRGGGGQIGVVTSLTFQTVPAPNISTAYLQWSFDDAVPVILAWQKWAPNADRRLWSTLKLLSGTRHKSPTIQLTATWTGPATEFYGQLAGFHETAGVLPLVTSVKPDQSYLGVMFGYAGCSGLRVGQCTTGTGGSLRREAFSATSHVPYDLLDAAGASRLVGRAVLGQQLQGARETAVSLDALGGAVRDLEDTATGFGHRKAFATVQYTATFDDGADPAPFDAFVRGSRNAMKHFWGSSAYFNYSDSSIADPGPAYFGDHASRLSSIRAAADPTGLFAFPAFRT